MSDISSILPEPPDGTAVVLYQEPGSGPFLIWRDDKIAREYPAEHADERWFDHDGGEDPLSWSEATKYATSVTVVPSTPTAKVAP